MALETLTVALLLKSLNETVTLVVPAPTATPNPAFTATTPELDVLQLAEDVTSAVVPFA